MKKIILLFLVLLSSYSFSQDKESHDSQLYNITIFKWSKDLNGKDLYKVINIDENGNLFLDKKQILKVDMNSLSKGFNEFIKQENIIKEEANDNPPSAAQIPEKGEQSININIITLADYMKEKDLDFYNKSTYSWSKIYSIDEINYLFYQYLSKGDKEFLNKILGQTK